MNKFEEGVMKNKHYIILLFIILVSCQDNPNVESDESNNPLIKSSKEFVTADGGHIDEEYGSTKEFEKHNLKIEYLTDTIYAQAVQYINACGDAIAWIELNGDTLIITTKELSEELCGSADWYKYEYWIDNPDNKKYVIIQRE